MLILHQECFSLSFSTLCLSIISFIKFCLLEAFSESWVIYHAPLSLFISILTPCLFVLNTYHNPWLLVWLLLSTRLSAKWKGDCVPYSPFCVHAKLLQSCPTLCDPMDCSPPGSSIHGILQARILEWVAIPFSRGSSPPRDQTHISYVNGIGFGKQVLYHQRHLRSPFTTVPASNQCLAQWKLISMSEWMNKWHGKVILFQLLHNTVIAVT